MVSDTWDIIVRPAETHLKSILESVRLDMVSPFFSGWTIKQLDNYKKTKVRLITRLPCEYYAPPAFIDNDPKPLRELMEVMGSRLEVYADPNVHAKIYVGKERTWIGSANFSKNGFSGKGEILLNFKTDEQFRSVFRQFRDESRRIYVDDMLKLEGFIKDGLTKKILNREKLGSSTVEASADVTLATSVTLEDFETWLNPSIPVHQQIILSLKNKNRMVGHAYSAFHGGLQFLSRYPKIANRLLIEPNFASSDEVRSRIAAFVEKYGSKYGGPRGGTWQSKLSTRFGGTQSSGGAGDTLVRRFLITLPKYMSERGLLNQS